MPSGHLDSFSDFISRDGLNLPGGWPSIDQSERNEPISGEEDEDGKEAES